MASVRLGCVAPLHTDTCLVAQVRDIHFAYVQGRMEVVRQLSDDSNSMRCYEGEHWRACMAPGALNPLFNQVFLERAGLESRYTLAIWTRG